MTQDRVLETLSEHLGDLERFGVESIAVFGSVARNEASPDSDVDLLVEFHPEERVGVFRFLELKEYLESILGSRVDLVTRDGLKRQLREEILGEAITAA